MKSLDKDYTPSNAETILKGTRPLNHVAYKRALKSHKPSDITNIHPTYAYMRYNLCNYMPYKESIYKSMPFYIRQLVHIKSL